jgi:hypothetical protein
VNSAGDAEADASFAGAEGEGAPERSGTRTGALPPDVPDGGPAALLGARHDLFLKEGASTRSCRCLAVHAGSPRDQAFEWESPTPAIDERSQLVVAFTSHGQVCEDEPADAVGASYHGYQKRGPDIVIMVEDARPGRPRVNGAIVPRPDPEGRLLFEPVPATLPYGRGTSDGALMCEVLLGEPTANPIEVTPAPAFTDDPGEAAAAVDSLQPNPEEEPTDEGEEARRTGLYLGAIVGPAYSILKSSEPDGKLSGFGVGFDFLLGGSPARNLAIGGLLGATVTASPKFEQGDLRGTAEDINMNVIRVGAFADYAFVGDLHGMLSIEFDRLSYSGSEARLDLLDSNGLGASLGLGYDFWVAQRFSLGVLGRFGYAFMKFDDSKGHLLAPMVGMTLTFH